MLSFLFGGHVRAWVNGGEAGNEFAAEQVALGIELEQELEEDAFGDAELGFALLEQLQVIGVEADAEGVGELAGVGPLVGEHLFGLWVAHRGGGSRRG